MLLCGRFHENNDDDMDVEPLEQIPPTTARKKGNVSYWDMYHALSSDDATFFPIELASCLRMVTIFNVTLFVIVAASKRFTWESRADGLVEGILLFLIMIALIPLVTRLRMQAFHHYGAIGLLKQEYRWVALFNGAQSSFAANSLVRIAKIHEMLNHHENALLTYQTIETTFPSFANRGRGGVMLHRAIGQSLMRLGRLPEALESHRVALQLTKAHHAHAILIQADLNAIAGIFELMGNLPAALAKRLEAWCVLEEIGHTQSAAAAICLTRMAHTYELMGDLDIALKKLETALGIFIAIEGEFPRSTTVARLYTRIGNLQVAMGNPAVEIFRHAIEVYRRSGMSDEHSALANLLRRSEAIEHV